MPRTKERLPLSESVPKKRRPRPPQPVRTTTHVVAEHHSPAVDPLLLAAAKKALRPGERIEPVSWTEVRTVYIR